MSAQVTFTQGYAVDVDGLYIAAQGDVFEPHHPFTRLFQFFAPNEPAPWTKHDVLFEVVAVGIWVPTADPEDDWALVVMSSEGDVELSYSIGRTVERIRGAGLYSDGATGWGYMSALKQIGEHLYACGDCGQVYKRTGPDRWEHMDAGLLQAPDAAERLMPMAIDGPHEQAIYLVGALSAMGYPPKVHFWDGRSWRDVALPPVAERLTDLFIESEARIWLCGANGTLLLGNAQQGFQSLSRVEDNQLFTSVCRFRGQVYLASNVGLFVYDPNDAARGIVAVVTGLEPELQDANVLDAIGDEVLWSIGLKDLARFDGERWERIHHPDNPRIGG